MTHEEIKAAFREAGEIYRKASPEQQKEMLGYLALMLSQESKNPLSDLNYQDREDFPETGRGEF